MRKNSGITLVSLVITIIIMLILAGVSLSMVTGDSSVLGQAKKTAFLQEIAGYKEELAISYLGKAAEAQKKIDKKSITAIGSDLKKYIPSIKEEDIDDYMISQGELYYVGDDEFELAVCQEQGYIVKDPSETAEEFAAKVEGNALESIIIQMAGGEKFMTKNEAGESVTAGTALVKKVAGMGFGGASGTWQVITELRDDQVVATYADGWYFVTAGTNIEELGTLRYSYIIDYANKKAVRFDPNKHSIISNKGSLAVDDGSLVYVADPTNMADGSSASWGKAILHGFTGTVKDGDTVISGWTDTAFITDGENDRVELPATAGVNYDKGITIEFYGKVIKNNPNSKYEMIFTRGLSPDLAKVITLGLDEEIDTAWFGYNGHRHWKVPSLDSKIAPGKQFFVSYRISPEDQTGKIYFNNEVLPDLHSKNNYGTNTWDEIKKMFNDTSKSYYFGYGRGTSNIEIYSNLAINTIRVYNRYLSDQELTANYNATVAYYNILLNGGNVGNNNDGGEDWDSVIK